MASLAAGPVAWSDLANALRDIEDPQALAYFAESLVIGAVPEEAFPHPQRALVREAGDASVKFETPGGVVVTITLDGIFHVTVEFGRDSRWLSWLLLTEIVAQHGWNAAVVVDGEELCVAEAIAAVADRGLREALEKD